MKILSVDTTGDYLVVALSEGPELIGGLRVAATAAHSEKIISAVEGVLAEAGMSARDVEKIAAVRGPGSFTGIRIGLTFARTFSVASGICAVSISSFDALAVTAACGAARGFRPDVHRDGNGPAILTVVDALAPEVHWALYDSSGRKRIAGPGLDDVESVARLAGKKKSRPAGYIFAGSAFRNPAVRDLLSKRFAERDARAEIPLAPSPAALARLAAASRGGSYKTLTPLYLKEVYLRK